MTALTLICLSCKGAGTLVGDAPCGICRGTGSVRRSGAVSEPPAPVITLEMLARHVRNLQQAALISLATDPRGATLAEKREVTKRVLQDMAESGAIRRKP